MIHIPTDVEFAGKEFMEAPEIDELAAKLCLWPELSFLAEWDIRFLWKAAGSGKEVAGRCKVLSGELAYFVGADWLIWLAADICRVGEFDDTQVEALLYHQLCHCEVKVDSKGEEKPAAKRHELEMFRGEVERYGLWDSALVKAKKVFDTAPLPGFERREAERPARSKSRGTRSAKDMRGNGITGVTIQASGHEPIHFGSMEHFEKAMDAVPKILEHRRRRGSFREEVGDVIHDGLDKATGEVFGDGEG